MHSDFIKLLPNLDKAVKSFRNKSTTKNFTRLSDKYEKLLSWREYYNDTDPILVEYALKYLSDYCRACLAYEHNVYATMNYRILSVLKLPDSLEMILKSKDADSTLSWCCCCLAILYTGHGNNFVKQDFLDLLSRWTGIDKAVIQSKEPSLEHVTTLLYGPAFWTVYGIDGDRDKAGKELFELVVFLQRQSLPLIFRDIPLLDLKLDVPEHMI